MEDEANINPLKKLFNSVNSVLIILPPEPDIDMVSAGLSLHLSLFSLGKKSQIGCGNMVTEGPNLFGVKDIASSVGNKNLQIIFDFPEDHLEKVDYDITPEGKFSLLIKPKTGYSIPDVNGIKFSYSGADADLVIVLGINSLEELGKIYADEKNYLDNSQILSLNTIGTESKFTPNMFHLANVSFSELVCLLLQRIEVTPTVEAASNLLNTIYLSSSNLTSPKMTADTFASIAFLMKNGGKLPQVQPVSPLTPPFFEPPMDWKSPKIFRAGDL